MSLAEAFEVVVETEPEWDDHERARMAALGVYESGICECGFHRDIATNRDNTFTLDDVRCPVCAAMARYGRIQSSADEAALKAAGENPPPGSPQPGDGRRTFVRWMSESEATEARAQRTLAKERA